MSTSHSSHFIANSQVRLDAAAHLSPRAMQIGFQLWNRGSGDLGDLLVAALLKHLQRKHNPLIFVQSPERVFDDTAQFLVQQLTVGRKFSVAKLDYSIVIDTDFVGFSMFISKRLAGDVLCDSE